jgi:transcriptional regulator with XRE-family HTH domain
MNDRPHEDTTELANKIARLVQERGWNQEDFASITGLNRQTIREILQPSGERRLRNATVAKCANALNLTVHELRTQPLERLLPRMRRDHPARTGDETQRQLWEDATQPELKAWLERNPERARQLTPAEIDEVLSLQATGGPLSRLGVEHYINLIERKRKLLQKVQAVAGTEYLDFLEQFVELLFDKVQPYRDRA